MHMFLNLSVFVYMHVCVSVWVACAREARAGQRMQAEAPDGTFFFPNIFSSFCMCPSGWHATEARAGQRMQAVAPDGTPFAFMVHTHTQNTHTHTSHAHTTHAHTHTHTHTHVRALTKAHALCSSSFSTVATN